MNQELQIINLYEQEYEINQIISETGLSRSEIKEILWKNHYMVDPQRKREKVLDFKKAIEEYIDNMTQVSMTSVAKKYKVSPSALGKFLKYLNIPVENKQNRVKFDDTVFDEIDSEEKAYWLGFLYADGYISSSPLRAEVKSRYDFELTLAEKDYNHLVKFNTFTKHEKLNIKSKSVQLDGKTFKSFRWSIINKHFWNTLNQLGCTPQKSLTLKFPTFLPLELTRHFIRGYFDGDGSLGIYTTKYDTKRIQVSCLGTESMLQGILNASNQTVSLQKDKRMTSSKTFEFELCSEKAVNFLNYIYKDCTIYLTRKYEKYLESCRLWEESHRLLESNIGGSCDANPEITIGTKDSIAS